MWRLAMAWRRSGRRGDGWSAGGWEDLCAATAVSDLVVDPPSSWTDVGATTAMGRIGCGGGERLGR